MITRCCGLGLCLLLSATAVLAMTPDLERMRETVATLTAPELAGRGAGTVEERQAATLIAGWFAAAGLQPALADGWLQTVPWRDGQTVNVLAVAPGDGVLAGRWLVLGAHLDHLGRLDPEQGGVPAVGAYFPGAGDNASGVAAVRALADWLGSSEVAAATPRRSVLVCAFGGEEEGLVGSRYLVANLPIPVEGIDAMLNLDAVGRLAEGPLHVAGAGTGQGLTGQLLAAADGVDVVLHEPLLLGSDHLGFLEATVPSLFFFTSAYPEMNSTNDQLAAVDLPGLVTVTRTVAGVLGDLLVAPAATVFVAPAEPVRPSGGNRATWFGTAPDFSGATAADGYLIGGVSEGGPAGRAGLLKGDVVLALGGKPVTDLATFTQQMRSFDPGDVVEVVARRHGRRLKFLVTLGDRSQR